MYSDSWIDHHYFTSVFSGGGGGGCELSTCHLFVQLKNNKKKDAGGKMYIA